MRWARSLSQSSPELRPARHKASPQAPWIWRIAGRSSRDGRDPRSGRRGTSAIEEWSNTGGTGLASGGRPDQPRAEPRGRLPLGPQMQLSRSGTALRGGRASRVRDAGGKTVVARPGQTVNIPALAPHAFRNPADTTARVLYLVAPAAPRRRPRCPTQNSRRAGSVPARSPLNSVSSWSDRHTRADSVSPEAGARRLSAPQASSSEDLLLIGSADRSAGGSGRIGVPTGGTLGGAGWDARPPSRSRAA